MQTIPAATSTTAVPATLVEQLRGVATAVARDIGSAAYVTVVVAYHGQPCAAVFTHPAAEALETIERTSGGPALDALWSGRIASIPTTLRDAKWPEYSLECLRQAVGSVAAFPIEVDGERRGVMTVASHDYFGFGVDDIRVAIDASIQAAAILRDQHTC